MDKMTCFYEELCTIQPHASFPSEVRLEECHHCELYFFVLSEASDRLIFQDIASYLLNLGERFDATFS
jgi:hypothetical protein